MYVVVKCPTLLAVSRFLNNNNMAQDRIVHIEKDNGTYSLLFYETTEHGYSDMIYTNENGKVTGGLYD